MKKIIDLTHEIKTGMTVYPNTFAPLFEEYNTIEKDGFAEMKVSMATHTGTHIDAPCHLISGAKTLSDFPLEKFTGKAVVIDCRNKETISSDIISMHEVYIKKADFVLFRTGWSTKWEDDTYFTGFPTLTEEAADILVSSGLKAVGFDCVSVDAISSEDLKIHKIFLSKDILIIENLTNLDKLSEGLFDFFAVPLKIEGSDGSPVRAFAEI